MQAQQCTCNMRAQQFSMSTLDDHEYMRRHHHCNKIVDQEGAHTGHLVGSSGDCSVAARSASLKVNSRSTKSVSGGAICRAQGDM